jgi:hypothetical protein
MRKLRDCVFPDSAPCSTSRGDDPPAKASTSTVLALPDTLQATHEYEVSIPLHRLAAVPNMPGQTELSASLDCPPQPDLTGHMPVPMRDGGPRYIENYRFCTLRQEWILWTEPIVNWSL